jgi:LPXTG-site transpeptidase (sortase) family protein
LAGKLVPKELLRRLRREWLGAALAGVLVFAAVALLLAWALAPEPQPPQPELSTSMSGTPATTMPQASAGGSTLDNVPRATQPREPTPTPPATLVERVPPERIIIPAIGVDAPLSRKSLDGDGFMQIPNGPEDVAWYDFTASPGEGSNVVFSGHLDYRGYGPAVFYRLADLSEGDVVEVRTKDGSMHLYAVSASVAYDAADAPVSDIVGPTSREVVTLITCSGTFNGPPLGYSHRLVVRAEPVSPA